LLATYGLVATEFVESYLSRYLLTKAATWIASERKEDMWIWFNQPWQWSSFVRDAYVHLPRPIKTVTSVSKCWADQGQHT
jgi:hypothetical protein